MSENLDQEIEVSSNASTKKYYDFQGIQVPYRASETVTVVEATGQTTERDIDPIYISQLKTIAKMQEDASKAKANLDTILINQSKYTDEALNLAYMQYDSFATKLSRSFPKRIATAILSLKRETLLTAVRANKLKKWGYEAPIAVSQCVPADHVYVDYRYGRIIINEVQATNRYIDADGDRAVLLFNEEKSQAVLVKFPITSQPLILTVIHHIPDEQFLGVTKRKLGKLCKEIPVKIIGQNVDEKTLFEKRHMEVQVGLMTAAWNSYDLYSARLFSWEAKNEYIFNSHIDPITGKTQRALDIEEGGMKAVRKDSKTFTEAKVLEFGAGMALAHEHAWFLTACSSIGGMRKEQLSWVEVSNLQKLVTECLTLNVNFRQLRPSPREQEDLTYKAGDDDYALLKTLVKMKLVGYQEFPHHHPNMPPCVMIWLQHPEGRKVALTDVKREGYDVGLTYAFIIPPIADGVELVKHVPVIKNGEYLYDDEGNLVTETKVVVKPEYRFVKPLNHLNKLLKTLDADIYTPQGQFAHHFPENVEEFNRPDRAIKVGQIQKFITNFCGRFGDPAPVRKLKDGSLQLLGTAKTALVRSAVVDYGQNMDADLMYECVKYSIKKHNEWAKAKAEEKGTEYKPLELCIVGSKSTDRRVRKYMLANAVGGCELDDECLAHPYRGAMNRAQIKRALKMNTYRVAIIDSPVGMTKNQLFITPSGIEKQRTSEAFFPQVFHTEGKYLAHLQAHGWTEEDCPAVVNDYYTWQGEKRRCWVIDARRGIEVGKVVDFFGSKAMPRVQGQWHSINYDPLTTEEIDLLYPVNEAVDKDMHHYFYKYGKEQDVVLPDGSIIRTLVLEWNFMRTGSQSENTPARWRMCGFKGFDSFPIAWKLNHILEEPIDRVSQLDLKDAEELQSVVVQFVSAYSTTSEPDYDYYE